jgi:threonine aldolase
LLIPVDSYDDVFSNAITHEDVHYAKTSLICIENTLHGTITDIQSIKKVSEFASKNKIRLHLDGARLWNAHIETGISIKEYCQHFDSVSLCFSKGLGAPVGSILASDKNTIKRALQFRKALGGG